MLVPDIGRRTEKYSEERWLHAAEPQPEKAAAADEHAHDHDHDGGKHDAKH
jgi:hypothetical protein